MISGACGAPILCRMAMSIWRSSGGIVEVTDAYLVASARLKDCQLATFDRALVQQYPTWTHLVSSTRGRSG